MSSKKQKLPKKTSEQTRSISKAKGIPVAEDSLQTKPPGAGPGPRQAATLSGSEQLSTSGEGTRGGIGAQQTGWSSRQQAERIQARAEESRLGMPRQSGHGGLEQKQHAGNEESPIGPDRSSQTAEPRRSKQRGGGSKR